jgi:hypothetical protein
MPDYTLDYLVEVNTGSWVTIADANIISVETSGEMTSNENNPAGFGDQATMTASVEVLRTAVSSYTLARLPIRITFTRTATSAKSFTGYVQSWSGDLETVTLECESIIQDLSNRTKDLYSPAYFRRPIATKTSASSVEDPTNGAYVAGLVNWILWQAGGRPNAQSGTYPSAAFYYDCEQAILAPDWTWVAGEDGWAECLKLARAAGGQLYQDENGVVKYKQPLTMVGTPSLTFTSSIYADISEEANTGEYAAKVTCSYIPRTVHVMQEVVNDSTPRLVEASATVVIYLEPRWPVRSIDLTGTAMKDESLKATFFDGSVVPQSLSLGYNHSIVVDAQRITLTIINTTAKPFVINRIVLKGEPIAAGVGAVVTAGSGTPVKTLEDNPYIQTKSHATRLAQMALSFYGTARATRVLKDCPYDPSRTVGETVSLTATQLGLSAAAHVIRKITTSETGAVSEFSLLDATGLPATADYWLCQSTSQSGTKKIAW